MNSADCTTMVEVRAGVDAIDRALVDLLVERFGLMDAAARIKQCRDAVRDEARKAQVIANVSVARGLPDGLAAQLWETLVEASIAYELIAWDARHCRRPDNDAHPTRSVHKQSTLRQAFPTIAPPAHRAGPGPPNHWQ